MKQKILILFNHKNYDYYSMKDKAYYTFEIISGIFIEKLENKKGSWKGKTWFQKQILMEELEYKLQNRFQKVEHNTDQQEERPYKKIRWPFQEF